MSWMTRLFFTLVLALVFLWGAMAGLTGPAQATTMDLAPAGAPAETFLTTDFTATGRSLTRAGDAIYLFDDFSGSFNWRFDTKTSQWYNVAVVGSPPRRYGYGAAAYNNDIYVVGGETPGGSKLDDVWRYDPATNTWSQVTQDTRPPGRSGHSVVGTTNSLLIYGGTMVTPTQETYLWKFDPATGAWSLASWQENLRGTRWGHSAGLLGDRWYAVGGVITDPTDFVQRTTWDSTGFESVPATSTVQPSLRKNLAAVFDTETTAIVVIGGETLTTSQPFTDTWQFDVGSRTWTPLPDLPQPLDNLRAAGWYSPATSSEVHATDAFTDGLHILIVGDPIAGGDPVSYVFDGDVYQLKSLPAAPDYDIFLPLVLRQLNLTPNPLSNLWRGGQE